MWGCECLFEESVWGMDDHFDQKLMRGQISIEDRKTSFRYRDIQIINVLGMRCFGGIMSIYIKN